MFRNLLKRNFISHKLFFSFSIKYRLLFYFLFLIFLPTTIITVTIFYKSQHIITQRVYNSIENNLAMIDSSCRQKLAAVNDVMSLIYFSPELQTAFSSPYFTSQAQTILTPQYANKRANLINEMSSLDKILDSYSSSNNAETALYPKLYINNRPEYLFFNSSDKVTDLSQIQNEDWYPKIPSANQYFVVGLNKVSTSLGPVVTLRIAKRLFGLNNRQIPFVGLLTMDVDISSFNSIMKNFKPSPGSVTFLVNKDNLVIASSDSSSVNTYLSKQICDVKSILPLVHSSMTSVISRKNSTSTLVSYRKISNPDYVIVSISPTKELYGELVSFNKVLVIVLAVCLILSLVMAMFLSENISYPIRKLVKSMSTVKDGNFDVTLHYRRKDEFAFLISEYKTMMGQIKDLIDKLYVSELNKKEAELKSLQAQINPHFLYNTLDSINWLSLKYEVPDISTMVTALSDFFRYSLNKGQDIISLENEKRQVESYLEIQKIRFKNKLDFTLDFSEEVLECLTVKLILQPIVENAILHGIEKRRGKGSVHISAGVRDQTVEISISDDGIGADVNELNKLLTEDGENYKSYGIRNVNKRIKHAFGEEFGLTFCSNEAGGVTVTIRIPVRKTMEEFDVKNDYSG